MRPHSPQFETAIIGVALGVAACAVAILASRGGAWPVIVLATVPLLVRAVWRSMPLWVLLVTTTGPVMVAEVIENQPTSATWLIGCVALVVAATDRQRRVEWIPIALVVGGPLWLRLSGTVDDDGNIFGIWMMGLLLSATLGTVVGQQRRLILTMREAQANLATAAAAEERHRIARDLHDIVGHSFSVVLLHLAGARHLMSTDHDRAEAALRQAEDVGRRSMNDLRASLALLRTADDSHAPTGGVEALPGLVDGMRQAGLDIAYSTVGDLDRVDAAIGIVVHSVAREALTNAAKHAAEGPIACTVTVDDHATLRVTNRVRSSTDAPSTAPSGLGLTGMGERVAAVGGSLRVDNSDGDWSVILEVPVRAMRGTS